MSKPNVPATDYVLLFTCYRVLVTQPIDALDLHEVVDYHRSQNHVRTWRDTAQ